MHVDIKDLSGRARYEWMIRAIVPRPIAFVSTVSAGGAPNLAPFSYFNGVTGRPPVVSIAIGNRRGGARKDTLRNIEETGELVINAVTEEIAQPMADCGPDWPPGVDEFAVAGLTGVPSDLVRPPRVAESPLAMECRLYRLVPVENTATLVLAEILRIHAREEILTDGLPDPAKFRPLGRLGGDDYAGLGPIVAFPPSKTP